MHDSLINVLTQNEYLESVCKASYSINLSSYKIYKKQSETIIRHREGIAKAHKFLNFGSRYFYVSFYRQHSAIERN